MKGGQLMAIVLVIITIVLGLFYSIYVPIESWSQGHKTDYGAITKAILTGIFGLFLISYFIHNEREKELTKIFGVLPVKLKHGFSWTAFAFFAVNVFGVNTIEFELTHIIATGSAIILGLVTMLLDADTVTEQKQSYLLVFIATIGFVLAYFFNFYSISWGESIVSIVLGYWMIFELINKSNT